jgi:hypothetical protein
MYNAFQPTPAMTAYAVLPARVPLDEMNTSTAWGAQASLDMNLREADLAPELELNEIVWRSVRGANSPMPPPRRAAFIRSAEDGDDDDDDGKAEPRKRKTKAR